MIIISLKRVNKTHLDMQWDQDNLLLYDELSCNYLYRLLNSDLYYKHIGIREDQHA